MLFGVCIANRKCLVWQTTTLRMVDEVDGHEFPITTTSWMDTVTSDEQSLITEAVPKVTESLQPTNSTSKETSTGVNSNRNVSNNSREENDDKPVTNSSSSVVAQSQIQPPEGLLGNMNVLVRLCVALLPVLNTQCCFIHTHIEKYAAICATESTCLCTYASQSVHHACTAQYVPL